MKGKKQIITSCRRIITNGTARNNNNAQQKMNKQITHEIITEKKAAVAVLGSEVTKTANSVHHSAGFGNNAKQNP